MTTAAALLPGRMPILASVPPDPWLDPVRAASTANVDISQLNNGDVMDGVTLATDDRVLLKNQSSGPENGIYVVGANAGDTVRASDFDEDAEVVASVMVPVEEGTTNQETGWMLSTNNPISVGLTSLSFIRVFASGVLGGTGTTNTLSKWTGATTVGDSRITDDGTDITLGGVLKHQVNAMPSGFDDGVGAGGSSNFRTQSGASGTGGAGADAIWRMGGGDGAGRSGRYEVRRGGAPNSALITDADSLIVSESAASMTVNMVIASDNATHASVLRGTRSRGLITAPTALQSGDEILRITSRGYDGSAIQGTALIEFAVDGSVSAGTVPQSISFQTGPSNTASRAERLKIDSIGRFTFIQGSTAGPASTPTFMTYTTAVHTSLPPTVECTDFVFNMQRNVQFQTGGITTQRAMRILAPTYSFVAASTISAAATVHISGAPVAGTNATITDSYAFWCGGASRFDGTMDLIDNVLKRPTIQDYAMTTKTVAVSGASETLDYTEASVFDVTMDQDCTFTFNNPPTTGKYGKFILILRGAWTPTWPASVDWNNSTEPTYSTPAVYSFVTVDGGTTWLGMMGGAAFG